MTFTTVMDSMSYEEQRELWIKLHDEAEYEQRIYGDQADDWVEQRLISLGYYNIVDVA